MHVHGYIDVIVHGRSAPRVSTTEHEGQNAAPFAPVRLPGAGAVPGNVSVPRAEIVFVPEVQVAPKDGMPVSERDAVLHEPE